MNKTKQTEQTRRFFDTAAASWPTRYRCDATVDTRKARFLAAVQAAFPRPADILDFGCGSGDIALHIGAAGHRLTGYDLSSAMIAQARRADSEHRVQWIAGADTWTDTLPFANATFDAVIASSVVEYVADIGTTLEELTRVLRPRGLLFATVPDMRNAHRHRERWLQRALALPGMAALMKHSRWREGAAYLRISVNRMPPEAWSQNLRDVGLMPMNIPEPTDPLLMLSAHKP